MKEKKITKIIKQWIKKLKYELKKKAENFDNTMNNMNTTESKNKNKLIISGSENENKKIVSEDESQKKIIIKIDVNDVKEVSFCGSVYEKQ